MAEIDRFIEDVSSEIDLILISGVIPNPEREKMALERLKQKYLELELNINPEREEKVIIHARVALKTINN